MSITLINQNESQKLSFGSWRYILRQGLYSGWEPQGTWVPTTYMTNWNGCYCTNDGQTVLDGDARRLCASLEDSLYAEGKHDRGIRHHGMPIIDRPRRQELQIYFWQDWKSLSAPLGPPKRLRGLVVDFLKFCEGRSFQIT